MTMNADYIHTEIETEGKIYTGLVRFETGDQKDLTSQIKEDEELTAYLFYKIPDKIKKQPERIIIYCEEDFRKQEEKDRYKYRMEWSLTA